MFRSRFPDVVVELVELNSPLLEVALAAGDIDLAVLHPPLATPGLATRPLPDLPLVLALPETHPLAAYSKIHLADLAEEAFLLAPRRIGPNIYDRIIALFQNEGISPNIVQEVAPMSTLTGLVAAGAGMGFVTAGIAAVGRPGVAFRPVEPDAPRLPLAAAWQAPEMTRASAAFLDVVAEFT